MSYNIRLGLQRGVEAIGEVIRSCNPDAVSLQEVGRFWEMGPPRDTLNELSSLTGLPYYDYVPTITRDRDSGHPAQYGHGVLSRWPMERGGRHDFTQEIDEPRAACWFTLDTPGEEIMLIATHLSHLDSERVQHGRELVALVRRLASGPKPVLLMGDLNEEQSHAEWMNDLFAMMQDAAAEQSPVQPTFPADEPSRRIDYLLADAGQWSNYEVVDEIFASDHRPVVAHWSAHA